MADTKFSFKTWYKTNKKSLNKGRRAKYDTDEEYRQRVLQMNRDARARRRVKQKKEKDAERGATLLRAATVPWKQSGQLFTIGALARSLGRSVQTVRLWEERGLIPPTQHRSEKGDRLYTSEQITRAVEILREQGKIEQEGELREASVLAGYARVVIFEDGRKEDQVLFRVGTLAKVLGKMVVTVEQMEQRGILPRTPLHYSKTRYRLYSAKMITAVRQILATSEGLEPSAIHEFILAAWDVLGFTGAHVEGCEPDKGAKRGRKHKIGRVEGSRKKAVLPIRRSSAH